jgi:UDP-3-O-[3-hydroxymyristoyl] glucosamine N-acyltransferase
MGSNSPIIYGEKVEIGEDCCFGPWSVLGDNVKIGNNVRIGSHTRIASNVEIAGHCRIGSHVIIKAQTELATGVFFDDFCISSGHCYIGEFSQIRYQSIIARNVHIEKECFFCAGVKLAYLDHTGNPVPVKNGLKIGSRTFVGDNSTILAGLQIAYGSVIGAHSLVTKDLNVSNGVYFGVPANYRRGLTRDEIIRRNERSERIWNQNDEVKLGQLSPYRTIKPGEKFKYEGGILPIGSFLGEIKIGYGVVIEEASVFYGNNFIGHNVVVRPRCIIGKYSELRVNSWLAEGVTIGEHSVIYNYANIAMGTLIGNYVYFGVHSITTNANDIVLHRGRPFIPNPVRIKDGARIAYECYHFARSGNW